ncbi:hypothetical protein CO693_02320 [Morganella morganii]|nr:hypothetical protein CO693_02320 [Morganella morganii]
MRGTTLTDLNKAYSKQGRYIAVRYIREQSHFFKGKTDSVFLNVIAQQKSTSREDGHTSG